MFVFEPEGDEIRIQVGRIVSKTSDRLVNPPTWAARVLGEGDGTTGWPWPFTVFGTSPKEAAGECAERIIRLRESQKFARRMRRGSRV
jgi:hypothetical protein